MAHFAELDADNKVIHVSVVANEDCAGGDFPTSEPAGQAFMESLFPNENRVWKQTSYSGSFRQRYAAIGGHYDANKDVFIHPQPFPSWILNEDNEWVSPVAKPDGFWVWDESQQNWVAPVQGE